MIGFIIGIVLAIITLRLERIFNIKNNALLIGVVLGMIACMIILAYS